MNGIDSKCVGEFTRVEISTGNGVEVVDESTIDYVCIDSRHDHLVQHLHLLEKDDLVEAIRLAATRHFGTKLVGSRSRAWFDHEVRLLVKLKKMARQLVDIAAAQHPHLSEEAKAILKEAKGLYSTTVNLNASAQRLARCVLSTTLWGAPAVFGIGGKREPNGLWPPKRRSTMKGRSSLLLGILLFLFLSSALCTLCTFMCTSSLFNISHFL